MNHELRTPLNGILGTTELILEDKDNHSREDLLQKFELISGIGQKLLRIINDILDFSKLESGKLDVEDVSFNLRSVCESITEMFQPAAGKKHIELILEISGDISDVVISDPNRISQILTNLMGNAIKFTNNGSVSLIVSLTEDHATNRFLNFLVADTGIGLSSEKISDLFKPFSQAEKSTSRVFGGTGLGLHISKNLAKLLGGNIDADSEPGVGSRFTLSIPYREATGETTEADSNISKLNHRITAEPVNILIVDDNEINASIIKKHLDRLGHRSVCCYSGFETLKFVDQQSFDIVFLDCHMPGMDGFEVSMVLYHKFGINRPYICALTASTRMEDQIRCLDSGMDAYLSKPVKKADLVREIQGYKDRLLKRSDSQKKPEGKLA